MSDKPRTRIGEIVSSLPWFKVDFTRPSDDPDAAADGRQPAVGNDANTVSSELHVGRHLILLDLDGPTQVELYPSSSPGHQHLYLQPAAGTIPTELFMELLDVLARCGVIESSYARLARERGAAFLRLPWITKDNIKGVQQ